MLGLTHAADFFISGRVVLAEEAQRMGLLNGVFPQAEFMSQVAAIASGIASNVSPAAAAAAKLQMYGELMTHAGGQTIETSKTLIGAMMKGRDFAEGVAAWPNMVDVIVGPQPLSSGRASYHRLVRSIL